MDKLWLDVLWTIENDGVSLNSRNGNSTEILGFSVKLQNVNQNFLFNKIRKLSPYYACAELLWYLSMTDDTSFLQLFAPGYSKFCEDGIHAFGAYGHRWRTNSITPLADQLSDQLTTVIEVLRKHPESRQAIITMWHGTDLEHARDLDKKDLPCTLTHQFLLREGYLHLVTNMRSNDAWLGLPYDVFCNTQLQKLIADILGVIPGSYTHNSGSMHYYEKNYEKIDLILSSNSKDMTVDIPTSQHGPAVTDLCLENQIIAAICFVSAIANNHPASHSELKEFHTIISDAAYVCASKFKPKLVKHIVDSQLQKAIEVFNE